MKTSFIYLLHFLTSVFCLGQEKGDLSITFTDVANPNGSLYIGVFEKKSFLKEPIVGTILDVKKDKKQVVLKDLPYGDYAISVYQDLNGNEIFDKDEYGRPLEPWVTSGNPKPNQMPLWVDTKFTFNAQTKPIKLKL